MGLRMWVSISWSGTRRRSTSKIYLFFWWIVVKFASFLKIRVVSPTDIEVQNQETGEHACVLSPSSGCDSIRRNNDAAKIDGKDVDFVFCIKRKNGKRVSELQAIKYKKSKGWTESPARNDCRRRGGKFEPGK